MVARHAMIKFRQKMQCIVQFTGLSGVGKTTLAFFAARELSAAGYKVAVLDGDDLRKTLSADLGFSRRDRLEHLRRLAWLTNETDADVVLVAVINPYEQSRAYFRSRGCGALVWLRCDLAVLRSRDTKGLYARAFLPPGHPDRLDNLTGVNDPYEEPTDADLIIDTGKETLEEAGEKLVAYLLSERNSYCLQAPGKEKLFT